MHSPDQAAEEKALSADDRERLGEIARVPGAITEDDRLLLRHLASAPPEVSGEGGHRVEITYDEYGLGPMFRLLHPETGCEPGEEGKPGTCWLEGWLEDADEPDGLLRGKLTVPVTYELDGDQPIFFLSSSPPEPSVQEEGQRRWLWQAEGPYRGLQGVPLPKDSEELMPVSEHEATVERLDKDRQFAEHQREEIVDEKRSFEARLEEVEAERKAQAERAETAVARLEEAKRRHEKQRTIIMELKKEAVDVMALEARVDSLQARLEAAEAARDELIRQRDESASFSSGMDGYWSARATQAEAVAAECYRLTGSDPDGDSDHHRTQHAVQAVRELREENERVGEWEDRAFKAAAVLAKAIEEFEREAERYDRYRTDAKSAEKQDRESGKLGEHESYIATWNYYEGLRNAYRHTARYLREQQAALQGGGAK